MERNFYNDQTTDLNNFDKDLCEDPHGETVPETMLSI